MRQERGFLYGGRFIPEGSLVDQFIDKAGINAEVTFRSNVTPDVTIDVLKLEKGEDGAQTGPGFSWLLELMQPEFEIDVLGKQYVVSPYGRPKKNNYGPLLAGAAIVGGGLIAWQLYKYFQRR